MSRGVAIDLARHRRGGTMNLCHNGTWGHLASVLGSQRGDYWGVNCDLARGDDLDRDLLDNLDLVHGLWDGDRGLGRHSTGLSPPNSCGTLPWNRRQPHRASARKGCRKEEIDEQSQPFRAESGAN